MVELVCAVLLMGALAEPVAPTPPKPPAAPGSPAPVVLAPKIAPVVAPLLEGPALSPRSDAKPLRARGGRPVGREESHADTSGPVAPSLTAGALRAELRNPRGAAEPSPSAPPSEARLEALGADIARAREALRQDTAHLEATLQRQRAEPSDRGAEAAREPAEAPARAPAPTPREAGRGQIETVSRAMAGMKAEQAAAILSRVDRVLAAEILRRMKAADAGGVMAALRPEVAAEIATEIAVRLPRLEPPKEKP